MPLNELLSDYICSFELVSIISNVKWIFSRDVYNHGQKVTKLTANYRAADS